MFGVHFNGRMPGPMKNSYLQLERGSPDDPENPILAGLDETERIINGLYFLDVEPIDRSRLPLLTLIPSYPDLPMEMVYPRVKKTDIAAVYLNEINGNRVVYFPWDIERTFWEVMSGDHLKLLANSIRWALNEEQPVTVTGKGLLDITIWRQKESLTVHLVNLTNPMMMKGPYREHFPIAEQKVKVHIPPGVSVKNVHLLVNEQIPHVEKAVDFIIVTVPSIIDREVIAIDIEHQ
jgi:hypothetical protein